MKVLSASQIRALDKYTIENEPISSVDLMERASRAFVNRFVEIYGNDYKVYLFCGTGNNGGDGLAIARMLHQMIYDVQVLVIGSVENGSPDFKINLDKLEKQHSYKNPKKIEEIELSESKKIVIVDALFGSGLNRKIEGFAAEVIQKINAFEIVSIDIASGLLSDSSSKSDAIVKPWLTISFQVPKLAFFQPENEDYVGFWEIVDIGLSNTFLEKEPTKYYFTTSENIVPLARRSFSHKGTFGHAFLIAGSYGMMGAAVLASKACLRSGIGKITLHVPKSGTNIIQTTVPEAILEESKNEKHFSGNWNLEKYDAVGIGPGIGLGNPDEFKLFLIASTSKRMVIDADAITFLGNSPDLLEILPENTILTPHPKEFKTLIGKSWENDFEKLEFLSEFAAKKKLIVCLKGKNTAVALSNGSIHFNSTGNSGMATAGSGDVLTGIILGFLAQGYTPEQAAVQGVYEHGLAGNKAATNRSERAMIASDIIENFR